MLWLTQLQTQYGVPDGFLNSILKNLGKLQKLENMTAPLIRKKAKSLYFIKSKKITLKSGTTISFNPLSTIQQQMMSGPWASYYSSTRYSKEDLQTELLRELQQFMKENPRHSLKILFGDGFSKTRTRGGTMCNLFFFFFPFFFLSFNFV